MCGWISGLCPQGSSGTSAGWNCSRPAVRSSLTAGGGLRATGHTASDQVETVLYRLVSSGRPGSAVKPKREDDVVRPLLELWREETEAYCAAADLEYRRDSSNAATKR